RLPLPLYCGTLEKPPPVGAVSSATTLKAAPAPLVEPALFWTVALPLPPWRAVGEAAVYVSAALPAGAAAPKPGMLAKAQLPLSTPVSASPVVAAVAVNVFVLSAPGLK